MDTTTKMMVSASAGAMNSVICKLTGLLAEEYRLVRSAKGGVQFMIKELSSMSVALEKLADVDEEMDGQTREWRDSVRELSFDLEGCIDRFMHRHRHSSPGKGTSCNFVRKVKRKIEMVWGDRQIGKEIRELKALVVEERARLERYNIDQKFFAKPQPSALDPRGHALYEVARDLIGIDGPREEVTGWLMEPEEKPKVVAIFGVGGSGKTTLALEVFHKIEEPFDCRAFVSLSRTPDVESLLRHMLFQIDKEKFKESQMWKMEQLIPTLRECLEDKRYLIVIDDIWSISAWRDVKSVLPVNNKRSRIIATTRKEDVARSCCGDFNGHMYKEMPLTENDSRILFFGRIFSSRECCPQELREVANEILRKCGGLPLAIISIASLLASNSPRVEVWVKIRNSISFAIEKDSPVERMQRILFLSYFDLPYYLKSCLLYLSVFPEDYYIDTRFLIWCWIAEGLITGVNREDMELLGESYLNQLINRSLIQPRKTGADGTTVKFCGVHDIIHDFIISQALKDNFIAILNGNGLYKHSIHKIRRLSLQSNFAEEADLPTKDVSHIRSLNMFGSSALPGGKQVPQNCGSLRLLNIEGAWDIKDSHIEHFGSFPQLRYLRIGRELPPMRSTNEQLDEERPYTGFRPQRKPYTERSIIELPEKIGYLQHLEVLDLRGAWPFMEKLPATIVQLQKLVCLFVHEWIALPDGIGNLQRLEQLSKLNLGKSSIRCIQGLGELTKLRALEISGSTWGEDCDMERRMEECISSLFKLVTNSLRSLHLTQFQSSDVINSWVFPTGSSPPLLHRLVLDGGEASALFSTIPSQIGSLVNLTRLRMERVREMGEEGVRILGSLPALISLKLRLGYGVRQDHLIDSQGFQRLVKFNFVAQTSLIFEAGAMPKLQRLRVCLTNDCQYNPGGLVQGWHHLSSIKHVTINRCLYICNNPSYMEALEDDIRSFTSTHPNCPIVEMN